MNAAEAIPQNFQPLCDLYLQMMTVSANPEEICLQLENEKVHVTKDDPSGTSLLQTFFLGRIDEANFPLVIKKITSEIEEIDQSMLDNSDSGTLNSLIQFVNAVGRKTFAHLTNNYVRYYCFQTPFEEYQIETKTTMASYSSPIKKGLRNLGRNICWFNATIKYLAITEIFDDAIIQGLKDSKTHNVCKKLLHLLNALRSDFHQNIIDSLHQSFMNELSKVDRFSQLFNRNCQDMDEFFVLFFAFLDSFTVKMPLRSRELNLRNDLFLISSEKKKEFPLRIQVHAKQDEPIDLARDMLQSSASDEGLIQEIFTDIPDALNISICRANFNRESGASFLHSPITFLPDQTIQLMKYKKKILEDGRLFEPVEIHVFEPTCAIIRKGTGTNSGHFTCIESTTKSSVSEHDDSRVYINSSSNPYRQAFFLHLKRKEIQAI